MDQGRNFGRRFDSDDLTKRVHNYNKMLIDLEKKFENLMRDKENPTRIAQEPLTPPLSTHEEQTNPEPSRKNLHLEKQIRKMKLFKENLRKRNKNEKPGDEHVNKIRKILQSDSE